MTNAKLYKLLQIDESKVKERLKIRIIQNNVGIPHRVRHYPSYPISTQGPSLPLLPYIHTGSIITLLTLYPHRVHHYPSYPIYTQGPPLPFLQCHVGHCSIAAHGNDS